jgi:hypothetical protein
MRVPVEGKLFPKEISMRLNAGFALSLSIACASLAGPAAAQLVGTYNGLTADGHNIGFHVVSKGGQLKISDISIGFTAQCAQTGTEYSNNYGIYSLQHAGIKDGKAMVKFVDPQFTTTNRIEFNGNDAQGTTDFRIALLVAAKKATQAQFCISERQAFTATFQGARGAVTGPRDGAPVVLPGQGFVRRLATR